MPDLAERVVYATMRGQGGTMHGGGYRVSRG